MASATVDASVAAGSVPTVGVDRRLGHIPQLDGLRGIAVLLTVAAHSKLPFAGGGGSTGVCLFFVLSGFLITSLLVQEWSLTGGISLRNFFARRLLRLMPALWLVLIVYIVLAFVAFNPITRGERFEAAFFVATYFGNWQNATGSHLAELSHTWSLAVEDQFYFIWPAALLIALRRGASRRAIVVGTVAVAAGLAVWRAGAFSAGFEWYRIYYGTDMVGSSLLVGCVAGLAYSWGLGSERIRYARWLAPAGVAAILLIAAIASVHDADGRAFFATVGFPLIALISAGTIFVVAIQRSVGRYIGHPVLRFFGRISYGLYLWHLLTINVLVRVFDMPLLERSWLSVPIAIAAATLSYYLVETRFLRLKVRLAPAPGQRSSEEALVSGVAPPAPPARQEPAPTS